MFGGGTVNGASLARGNAVVYSSPTLGGFNVQAGVGEDDVWDAALRYAGEFAGFRFAAGVGYTRNVSGINEVTKDISVAACTGGCNNGSTTGIVCNPTQCEGVCQHYACGLRHIRHGGLRAPE